MKKLQIGDKIYATHNNDIGGILEIARTTPTLGITPGGMKFKINTTDNGLNPYDWNELKSMSKKCHNKKSGSERGMGFNR